MKEDIFINKVGDVCDVIPGQSPKSKFYNDEGDGLPFYQGKKRFTDKFLDTPVKWTTNITKEAVDGDILMSVRAPVGPVNFATQKICIGRGLAAIRPKEKVNRDYLFYFFLKNEADLESTSGAVFDSINSKQIRNIKIPIPPLPEQKRIVAILDEAFEAIDKAKANVERNIQNAEELFQSKLDSFNYNKTKLEDIVDIKTGKLNANQAVEDGDYVFFTCSRESYRIDRYSFDCEAILLAGNNASGDFNVKHYKGKFDAYQRTYIITVKDESDLDYRFLYFQIYNSLKKLKSESIGTATRYLKMTILNNLEIAFPDIQEQKKYVRTMDNLLEAKNELVLSYKKKITGLEELKKSILQKAFSGELTVDEHVAA